MLARRIVAKHVTKTTALAMLGARFRVICVTDFIYLFG